MGAFVQMDGIGVQRAVLRQDALVPEQVINIVILGGKQLHILLKFPGARFLVRRGRGGNQLLPLAAEGGIVGFFVGQLQERGKLHQSILAFHQAHHLAVHIGVLGRYVGVQLGVPPFRVRRASRRFIGVGQLHQPVVYILPFRLHFVGFFINGHGAIHIALIQKLLPIGPHGVGVGVLPHAGQDQLSRVRQL